MGKTISSVPEGNSKNQPVDASKVAEIKLRIDTAACLGEIKERKEILIDNAARKRREELVQDVPEFNKIYSSSIIGNALKGSAADANEIKDRIMKLDPFITGEILLTIEQGLDIKALTDKSFLDSLSRLDVDIACALLYEIRLTTNVAALTHESLFTDHAAEFLNKLGAESASEWMNSIGMVGMPGNFGLLTSEKAMSADVLSAINGDAKIASELSYAMGVTGKVDALANPAFLGSLKALKNDDAASLLSRVWYTKSIEGLIGKDTIEKISKGGLNVWDDAATIKIDSRSTALPPVIIAKLGIDSHDRGAKLNAQLLADSGLKVVYINAKSASEIVDAAKRVGAGAIGFSIMDDSFTGMALGAAEQLKTQGINGIKIFGGGAITQGAAKELQQSGVKMFGMGTTGGSVLQFLGVAQSQNLRQSSSAWNDTTMLYAMPILSGQTTAKAVSVQSSAAINYSSSEDDSKKKKRLEGTDMHSNSHKSNSAKRELPLSVLAFYSQQQTTKIDSAKPQPTAMAARVPILMYASTSTSARRPSFQYVQTATYASPIGNRAVFDAHPRYIPNPTASTHFNLEEEAKRKRRMENFGLGTKACGQNATTKKMQSGVSAFHYQRQHVFGDDAVRLQGMVPSSRAPIEVPAYATASTYAVASTISKEVQSIRIAYSDANIRSVVNAKWIDNLSTKAGTLMIGSAVHQPANKTRKGMVIEKDQISFNARPKAVRAKAPINPTRERLHVKTFAAAQAQSEAKRPTAARKGIKMSVPISWNMKLFDRAADSLKRFSAARKEKTMEKLLSRSREFGDKLETEAKRFGVDLRILKTGNYYEALGLKYTTDHKAIKEAYHALVKRYHPDVSKDANAEEMTKKINEAYAVLKDKTLKEEYDRNFSKGKNRISSDASRRMSEELMKQYIEVRNKDFKEFEAATSVPLQREAIRSEIEKVCNWNKRLDRASIATFRDFRDYGKTVKRLAAINKKLLKREKSEPVQARLKENGRKLDELVLMCGEMENGIAAVKANAKKEISSKESGIIKRLRSLV